MTPGLLLPSSRSESKDTAAYMALMNTKPYLVARAAAADLATRATRGPLPVYAWIDAGAIKMWGGSVRACSTALDGVMRACVPSATFVAPGCWPAMTKPYSTWAHAVCWRFCGTFFAVAGDSVLTVCAQLCARFLALVKTGHTTWEVNVWALLEAELHTERWAPSTPSRQPGFKIGWYRANHDATLLDIPRRIPAATCVVVRKTTCDGLGNVLKCYLSLRRIHDNVAVECAPGYMYGTYDAILQPHAVCEPGTARVGAVEVAYTCRLLVLKDEEGIQQHIANEFSHTDGCQNAALNVHFSASVLIDWNYDCTRLAPSLMKDVIRTVRLVPWHASVVAAVAQVVENTGLEPPSVLSVSVRTWRAKHERGINRPYTFDAYAHALRAAVADAGGVLTTVLLSIDIDDAAVWRQYHTLLEDELGLKVFGLDGPVEHAGTLPLSSTLLPLQVAAVKMLLLARGSVLVANRISTYSELIFWFGECRARVYPVH
jgi:hypothetical protein